MCASFVCRHVGRIHQLLKWDLAKDAGRKGRRKDGMPLPRAVSQPKRLGHEQQPARLQEHACNLNHDVRLMLKCLSSHGSHGTSGPCGVISKN